MSYTNVMVDLETLDSAPTALILSVGAVRFSLEELKLAEETFYRRVNPASGARAGLTVSVETVKWWLLQTDSAKKAAFGGEEDTDLQYALINLATFIKAVPGSVIWGNGATFDNMILRNAYAAVNIPYPVSYREDLCYRTMRHMFPVDKVYMDMGTAHNALDDARNQALTFIELWRKLKAPQKLEPKNYPSRFVDTHPDIAPKDYPSRLDDTCLGKLK